VITRNSNGDVFLNGEYISHQQFIKMEKDRENSLKVTAAATFAYYILIRPFKLLFNSFQSQETQI
jgi:hypothetical protein